jgi:hypothetical protein
MVEARAGPCRWCSKDRRDDLKRQERRHGSGALGLDPLVIRRAPNADHTARPATSPGTPGAEHSRGPA